MAQNFWTALVAWTVCFVITIVVSLLTPRTKSDAELTGLVYSLTPKQKVVEKNWYERPAILGVIILALTLALNIIFA